MFSSLGLVQDMKDRVNHLRVYIETNIVKARGFIYTSGNTVDGAKVEETLREGSWTPVLVSTNCLSLCFTGSESDMQNKFVGKLGALGFDAFQMLVVDLMHECELGTWKALFTHLVRILYALPGGNQLVSTLDSR